MHLCLFRHASRNPFEPSGEPGDGGLNARGLEQARALPTLISPAGPLPRPTHLLCSPKRRARQTLAPLADHLGLPVEIATVLDERGEKERLDGFLQRLRDWLGGLSERFGRDDVVFACSHLDVLEKVMALAPNDLPEVEADRGFAPGEYRLFQLDSGFFASKGSGRA